MKKLWSFTILFLLCLVACAPAVLVTPTGLTSAPKPSGCHIDIYYPGQKIPYPNKDIAHIRLGDAGLTMICDKETMINLAKEKACSAGADAVYIHDIRLPDFYSTCYRIEGRMIKYEPIQTVYKEKNITKTTSLLTKQDALTNTKNASERQKPLITSVKTTNVTHQIEARWAVIIGISNYKDTRIPYLRYASSDAQAFYDWAVSPNGGKFAPSMVKLLLDKDATGKNIRNAFFIWLKQAIREDVVVIYFAGHGSPESPDSTNNLFLLPYDALYDEIATSGFPMWDIETALKRFIKAKKVVVIADACHSGGVGQPFDVARRASRAIRVNPISTGLQNLSQIGDGVCVISASDDKQFSQESEDWGGGHGVFTYFLLEGLKGNADYNKDRNVTLGELIPYLSEQVRRATSNAQSPTVAGKFDPALSIGK